jgi:hypothetical protein
MPRHSALCGAFLVLALGGTPAVAAPVLIEPPTGKPTFPIEFKVEAEPKGAGLEVEGKVKWERKDPEEKLEEKLKQIIGVPDPGLAFLFTLAPDAGGVRLGFEIDGIGSRSIVLTDAQAGLVPLHLMELEVKVETKKNETAAVSLSNLAFNGEAFADTIALTAPALNDKGELKNEAKRKLYFALPGGDPFVAPFTISGLLAASGAIDEFEVKIKFGDGTFVAPPKDDPGTGPTPVPEPASLVLLGAAVLALAGTLRVARVTT